MANDTPGMHGKRSRNKAGLLREKRGDTNAATIEKVYDRDFGVRGDMHLDNLLKKTEMRSLSQLIKSGVGKKK